MAGKFIIAIDLGGTNLKIALLDPKYNIVKKQVLGTRRFTSKGLLIAAITDSIMAIMAQNNLRRRDLMSVGLGLPGPIDVKRGLVHFFPNIPGWKEVELKKILEARLRMPVFLDNDANLMCLAEYRLGAARKAQNVLCITLGTGVGGGLIINGTLYRGSTYAAGEFGHTPINESGSRCGCGGIACLETYIGNNRVLHTARKVFKREISLEELSALAKRGNRSALRIWDDVGRRLGIALTGTINLINLDIVVIGGGVANAGKVLFDTVRRTVNERAMSVQSKNVKIVKAALGSDAGLIGAAILAKEGLEG